MLTANLMRQMSMPHLLSAGYAETDALTRTDLERELLARCEDMQEHIDTLAPVEDVLYDTDMPVEEAVLLIRRFEGRTASIQQTIDLQTELEDKGISPKDLSDLLRPLTSSDTPLATVTHFIESLYYEMDRDLDAALGLLTALYDQGITTASQLSPTHLKEQPCTP